MSVPPHDPTGTLYQIADNEIRACIAAYLELQRRSKGLADVRTSHLQDDRVRWILLAGMGVPDADTTAAKAKAEFEHRSAIPFDVEAGITFGVYRSIRGIGLKFLNDLEAATNGFVDFDPEYICAHPHYLPLFQHLGGIFSKSALKKLVGTVSDRGISRPAALRLAALLKSRVIPSAVNKGEVLKRLESTLEGIVRDLVGRVLLESIVDSALRDIGLEFQRENEYPSLPGVLYDFRADFVIPSYQDVRAFIEVRKSSSRHASLYAKDKMFSAINWKGCNRSLLAILIVDGEWTGETLRVMAKVFDYVVPIGRVAQLAEIVKAYVEGDQSAPSNLKRNWGRD